MEFPIIIETVTGNQNRATCADGVSIGLTDEGTTVAEAIYRLAEQVRTRVNAGATSPEGFHGIVLSRSCREGTAG